MGTNYYLHTTDKAFAEDFFPCEYELCDEPYFSYRVHLNKCSGGWRTLFQAHEKAYKSVKEMSAFLAANEGKYEIFDEYGKKFNAEEYAGEVLERDGQLLEKRTPYCWKNDKIFGGMSLFPCGEGDEPVIWSPFDHQEYERAEAEFRRRRSVVSGGYFSDGEGYNFSRREFS